MKKKIKYVILIAVMISASIGLNQSNAAIPHICKKHLSKIDQKALYELAKNFLSSKTNTPKSDLKISQSEIIISGDKSLSLISFIGEDFSDHSSRIDRCYVATYKKSNRSISVINRNFQSNGSEDTTPCTSTAVFNIKEIDSENAWITYRSNYRNPQIDQASGDDILEIYNMNFNTGVTCYDEKLTDEANLKMENPNEAALNHLLESRRPSSLNQCSK